MVLEIESEGLNCQDAFTCKAKAVLVCSMHSQCRQDCKVTCTVARTVMHESVFLPRSLRINCLSHTQHSCATSPCDLSLDRQAKLEELSCPSARYQ